MKNANQGDGQLKGAIAASLDASKRRKRTTIVAIIVALVAIAIIAGAIIGHMWYLNRTIGTSIVAAQSGGATVTPREKPLLSSSLPFSLDGVPANGSVVEVSEGQSQTALSGQWSFGGDFSQIGSFPIDASTVFGSSTSDPNNLKAYYAAMIHQNGSADNLDPSAQSGTFYEPQDGTGDASRVVWRSSTMNGAAQTGIDNWRLQTWDKASGATRTLGSASDLNGREDTPATYGEVVPTFNQTNAYFASLIPQGEAWQETILQYALAGGSAKPRQVDAGNFPAAVDDGVIYASGAAQTDKTNRFRIYEALKHDDGAQSSTVFTVRSDGSKWGIGGVWAHGGFRAVAVSDGTTESGTYIGLWSDGFKTNLGWVHVKSPSVVASMNGQWIVWGSGSQADNAGMYAFNWSRSEVKYLGATQGYSRPTIASGPNVVLVPRYDGTTQAVSFDVGGLE